MTKHLSRFAVAGIIVITITLSLFFNWNGTPLNHAIAQDGTVETAD
jgi:hypothetical protein